LREVLNRVLEYDADALICGHGPTLTLDHIRRFSQYFETMLQQVPPLLAQGVSVEEIERQVPPPDDMRDWWRFVDWKHKKNIELIAEFYQS
jgi:hypothetical protein